MIQKSVHKFVAILFAAIMLGIVGVSAEAATQAQSNTNCAIPASGPWPACATGGGSSATNNNASCIVPASGPWPPCATGGTSSGSGGGTSETSSISITKIPATSSRGTIYPRIDSAISANGRYVAFIADLRSNTNVYSSVFVYDAVTKTTREAASFNSGSEPNGQAISVNISDDGRWVSYVSAASNLVAGDTNGATDMFLHDMNSGTTRRVSVATSGEQANTGTYSQDGMSADGRYLVFVTYASNLVAGDTNGKADVFVHDAVRRQTHRVSVGNNGVQSFSDSWAPSISADGRYVSFTSDGIDASSQAQNLYVRDTVAQITEVVPSSATKGNITEPRIASNGRAIVYVSPSREIVSDDTQGHNDVFVFNRSDSSVRRVSIADQTKAEANSWSRNATISANGRKVAFNSPASNLVTGDTNGLQDIFVHDLDSNRTQRINVYADGRQADRVSGRPAISADGNHVAFYSYANLTNASEHEPHRYALYIASLNAVSGNSNSGGGTNNCVIPPSGPWPACATSGGTSSSNSGTDCIIPTSGPWPACARNGGGSTSNNNGGGSNNTCSIPASGPWPPCATGGGNSNSATSGTETSSQPSLCYSEGVTWLPCGSSAGSLKISRFSATATPIGNGNDRIDATWETQGANRVELLVGPYVQRTEFRRSLALSGTTSVVHDEDNYSKSFIRLRACDDTRTSGVRCIIQEIPATFSCENAYFFNTTNIDLTVCASDSYRERDAIYQQFENGFMIWVEDWPIPRTGSVDKPAVLIFYYNRNFEAVLDSWQVGQPISDASLTPPAGRLQPTNGLGKVWREHAKVREQLGWATADEVDYSAESVNSRSLSVGPSGSSGSYLSIPNKNQVLSLSRRVYSTSLSVDLSWQFVNLWAAQ